MFNKDFYPTPESVIEKMLVGYNWNYGNRTILEPSAGKGDIVDYINAMAKRRYFNCLDIDCIEKDTELQAILKGKGMKLVHNDFLTYNTFKKYDLIVMNPPFSEGDKHLLKAIRLQERYGGDIICLLNAETLKNQCTNTRKELVVLLNKYNADVEYIENCFNTTEAERRTDVEIALIKIKIEKVLDEPKFLTELKSEPKIDTIDYSCNELTKFASENDFVESIVEQFNTEVAMGIKLIEEFEKMRPYIKQSLKKDYNYGEILSLKIDNSNATVNNFLQAVRKKYWEALFTNDKFVGKLTSNLKQDLYNQIEKLKDYDFSIYNIMTIQQDMIKNTIKGVEDTIIKLFDEFSQQYSWCDTSKNIHYYNGWKTNKAWKVNDKVILPISAYNVYSDTLELRWRVKDKFNDIIQVFNYLQTKKHEPINVDEILKYADEIGNYTNIDLGYFTVTFYKKGTTHIKFKDLELLEKFNLYGSQKKGWLPPEFGKTKYKDLNSESKKVVDDYCGEKVYNDITANQNYYLVSDSQLLQICG